MAANFLGIKRSNEAADCGEIECFRAAPNQERPLLALFGHPTCTDECPLSGVKRT
jgi:hypothetical protein